MTTQPDVITYTIVTLSSGLPAPTISPDATTSPVTTTQLDIMTSSPVTPSVHATPKSTSTPDATPTSSAGVPFGIVVGVSVGAATLLGLLMFVVSVCLICVWRRVASSKLEAKTKGDIPMEECAAHGTLNTQQTRGRGDTAIGEYPAYEVVEQQQGDEDDAYENIGTATPLTC